MAPAVKAPPSGQSGAPHGVTVEAAATTTAWRSEQERPAALVRRPRSSAPRACFFLRMRRPLIYFLTAVEHASRLSRRALR